MGLSKYRWQKVVNELRFLYQELDLCMQICEDAAPVFQSHYEEMCRENNVKISPSTPPSTKQWRGGPKPPPGPLAIREPTESFDETIEFAENLQDSTKDSEIYKIFHKLFKKIIVFLHPDKFPKDISIEERQEKISMFNKAKRALETRHYFILLDYAQRLKIEIPTNYEEQIEWMRAEAKAVQHEMSLKHSTYGYQYAMCETDEQRRLLVISYIKQTRGIEIS